MKRPVRSIDEPEQRPPRADRPPTEGFVVIVDGHFKSEFDTAEAAELSGRKLKSIYPMLKIEIYDAITKVRTLLSLDTQLSHRLIGSEKSPSERENCIVRYGAPRPRKEDCCSLVFDTDTKSLYIEREVARLETALGGTVEF